MTEVEVCAARNLTVSSGGKLPSPFVEVVILAENGCPTGIIPQKSSVMRSTCNPVWGDILKFPIQRIGGVKVLLWSKRRIRRNAFLGQLTVKTKHEDLVKKRVIDDWFQLSSHSKKRNVSGQIRLRICYSYFPLRRSYGPETDVDERTSNLLKRSSQWNSSDDLRSSYCVVEEDLEDSEDWEFNEDDGDSFDDDHVEGKNGEHPADRAVRKKDAGKRAKLITSVAGNYQMRNSPSWMGEECFLEVGTDEDQAMFEFLCKNDLKNAVNELVDSFVQQMCLSEGEVLLVLKYFGWNPDKLLSRYFDDADEILIKSGVKPRNPPVVSRGSSMFSCPVCLDDVDFTDSYSLKCCHRYCLACWQSHLSTRIADHAPDSVLTPCMSPGCTLKVTLHDFKQLATPNDFDKYWYFLMKGFVESDSHTTFCSNPSCSTAIRFHGAGKPQNVVQCECGQRFCFSCGSEEHNPISCSMMDEWKSRNEDDTESQKYLNATSKPCFHCGVHTERTTGCNHMTCKMCKGEWCWMCRGDWAEHGSSTGGFFSCNKYETSVAKDIDEIAERTKSEAQKFLFYYERYFMHSKTQQEIIEKKIAEENELRNSTASWDKVLEVKRAMIDAFDIIAECHHVLKFTYVFGYFNRNSKRKDFFEFVQGNAEGTTERLAVMALSSPDTVDIETLLSNMSTTKSHLKRLADALEELV